MSDVGAIERNEEYLPTGKELKTMKIGPRLWIITQNFTMGEITVPAGFVTDGASVPRLFHNILAPMTGAHAEAAIIHDYLYSLDSEKVDRKFADLKFLELMAENGTPWFRRKIAYRTVRMFGRSSFRKMKSSDKVLNGAYLRPSNSQKMAAMLFENKRTQGILDKKTSTTPQFELNKVEGVRGKDIEVVRIKRPFPKTFNMEDTLRELEELRVRCEGMETPDFSSEMWANKTIKVKNPNHVGATHCEAILNVQREQNKATAEAVRNAECLGIKYPQKILNTTIDSVCAHQFDRNGVCINCGKYLNMED